MILQLTPALEQKLEQLAASTHRTPSDLVEEAVEELCSREERIALIKQGDEDFGRGDFFTSEEVRAHIEEIFSSR